MPRWCGACRNEITAPAFGNLCRFDWVDGVLVFPKKGEKFVPPNAPLCETCWRLCPESVHVRDKLDSESNYRYVSCYKNGFVESFIDGIPVSQDTVVTYFPLTQARFAKLEKKCDSPGHLHDPAFARRLIEHLRTYGFRVHGMKEFAPGAIAVHDNLGAGFGTFYTYFDIERWDFSIPPPRVELPHPQGMGMFYGEASSNAHTFDEMFVLAMRFLKPLKGDAWSRGPRYVAVPKDLWV